MIDQPLSVRKKESLLFLARKYNIDSCLYAPTKLIVAIISRTIACHYCLSTHNHIYALASIICSHDDHCVLFTGSGRSQNQVHYWSLYDNKILRKFRGHTDGITNLSMSPIEDLFLTASKDRTVRLWNADQAGCLAKMDLPANAEGNPSVVFDSTGLVFAVMAQMTRGQGHVSRTVA